MIISYQDPQAGHKTLTDLTDAEVEEKFRELTSRGFSAFAGTLLDEAVGPIKSVEQARELNAEEIYFTAPMQGG